MLNFDFANITNTELFATIISFLSANVLTILTMVILIIKNKIKNYSVEELIAKAEAKADVKLGEKYEAKAEEAMSLMVSKLDELYNKVCARLNLDSEEKKAIVEEKTETVNKLTEEIRALIQESGE